MLTKLAAILAVVVTSTAFAANVDCRQHDMQGRINQGVRDGSLNRYEYGRLEGRERGINREIARDRFYNGGRLTRGERFRIERQENGLSRSIYRERHDFR
jgi:hypothetical protein